MRDLTDNEIIQVSGGERTEAEELAFNLGVTSSFYLYSDNIALSWRLFNALQFGS